MKVFRNNIGHQPIGLINEFAGARDDNSDVALQDIQSGKMLHRKSGALGCANNRRRSLLAGDADKCSMDICTTLADEIVETARLFYHSCVAVSETSRIIVDMGVTGTYEPVKSHRFYQGAFFEIAPRSKGGKVLFVSYEMVTMLKMDYATLRGRFHRWYSRVEKVFDNSIESTEYGLRFVFEKAGLTGNGCFSLMRKLLHYMVHTVRLKKEDSENPRWLWVLPLRLWLSGLKEARSFSQLMQIASEVQTGFVRAAKQVDTGYELASVTARDPEDATENWYSRGLLFDFDPKEASEISQMDTRYRPFLHYHSYRHPKWTGEVVCYRGLKEYRRNR